MASGDGFRVFAILEPILERLGPSEFGRICQILLGFTFLEGGYQVPIMQLSGRPDIVVKKREVGYALEVKAQLNADVSLKKEDIDGVVGAGPTPVVAILTFPDPDTQWILADAGQLSPRVYNKLSLRRYSLEPVEAEVNRLFPSAAQRMGGTAGAGSGVLLQAFLDVRARYLRA